jgi:hypothetical protein
MKHYGCVVDILSRAGLSYNKEMACGKSLNRVPARITKNV